MNSPLTTAVVGTSTASPPPKAPLTPAMARTSAIASAAPTSPRFLFRDISLHRHPRLQAGRHDDLMVVHRAQGHWARTRAIALHHMHRETVLLARDRVARHDDHVVLPLELDVDRGRQVGHELRMISLDAHDGDEVPDLVGEPARRPHGRDLFDLAREFEAGIRVQ